MDSRKPQNILIWSEGIGVKGVPIKKHALTAIAYFGSNAQWLRRNAHLGIGLNIMEKRKGNMWTRLESLKTEKIICLDK